MKPLWSVSFGVFLSLPLSCKEKPERSVKDTEGRSFTLHCRPGESSCGVSQSAGPKSAVAGLSLHAEGRLVGVCSGEGTNVHPADCRPLVCQTDTECPPTHGAGSESCLDGLCVDPSHEIGAEDAVMLCLAGTGIDHTQPRQVERYALGLNCGSPCVVPSPCRQP
jgi:hypothetical protein